VHLCYTPYPASIIHGQWARFIFVAGRLCIDFAQTGGQTGKRAYWERFHQPSDLADWLAESPLQVRAVSVHPEEFLTALALREAIWAVAQSIWQGQPVPIKEVELINRVAAEPDLAPQLMLENERQEWHSPCRASQCLSTIARDAIDLFSGNERSRIRECENPSCRLMFVDSSRPGKRRWCLMKRCGNMAKTSRYRSKQTREEKGKKNKDE
jgi:predicted RNA-binding Zn ribbon-like protein